MDAPKLNPQDTLKQSYPKLNQSIDNANEALNRVANAENNSAEAKEIAEQTQTELRQAVLEGDSSPLAGMLSVGADGTVYEDGPQQRLVAEHNKVTAELATIEINVDKFGATGDGVTDDTQAIEDAISFAPIGATVKLPGNGYKITRDILLEKTITIKGRKRPVYDGSKFINGTYLDGFGFKINNASNVTIEDIGVITASDNAFEIRGNSNDSIIEECIGIARDHSFLIEEYEGSIERTVVRNCFSFKSIHGFVSKAKRTMFENCHAFNHTSNGFVIVSDNIKGASLKGLALSNTLLNCTTTECLLGYNAYSRDYHSENNSNEITLEDLTLINCHAFSSTGHGFMFGDGLNAPSGMTYNPVLYVNMLNCYERGQLNNSLRIERATNIVVDNFSCLRPVFVNYTLSKQVKVNTNVNMGEISNYYSVEVLTINNQYPTVKSGRQYFKTANTSPTTILNFADANDGQIVEVRIDDDYTTIGNGGNFNLSQGSVRGKGSSVKLFFDGSKWNEIYSKTVGRAEPFNIVTNGNLDLLRSYVWDLQGEGTSQPINFTNTSPESRIITLMFRSTSGTTPLDLNFGNNIQLPSEFPTQATYSDMVIANFTFNQVLGKWYNCSWQKVPTGN